MLSLALAWAEALHLRLFARLLCRLSARTASD